MITRITRGTLVENAEGRVFELLRAATQAATSTSGLVSMSVSRTVQGRHTALVAVTVWTDVAAMAAVLGPTWQEPRWSFLPGLTDCIVEASVEILETVAMSAEDFAALAHAS